MDIFLQESFDTENVGIKRHKLTLPQNLISVLDDRLNDLRQYVPEEFQ